MPKIEPALAYARKNREQAVEDLRQLIRIPSISMTPENQPDVLRGAEWVAQRLRTLGVEDIQIMPTAGHPVVYGHWRGAGQAPTILVYGHYDVQPVDPLDLWKSDPFEAEQRGENLYGRGASDMKGQLIALLQAFEAVGKAGKAAVNLKFLIEGEEETGSPSLETFLKANAALFACDACLNIDGSILAPDEPMIVYGVRGLAYFEVHVQAADHDLHSGMFGGAVDNPAIVLSRAIAGMRDPNGHVSLPGFYDDVQTLSAEERQELSRLPQGDDWWLGQTGAPSLFGEQGFSVNERVLARPTLDVNGFLSGFTGVGSKTVLPARAMAKISMRLVPDQTPDAVQAQLEEYLRRNAPPTVRWEVQNLAGAPPAIVRRDTHEMGAAIRALKETFGVDPVFVREGGTIAVVGILQELTGHESILMGFGLPDDNLHSPNERLFLPKPWAVL